MIEYLITSLITTVKVIFFGLVPLLLVVFATQWMSDSIRLSLTNMMGLRGYVYLTFPGVILHETGHLLFCLIFRHRVTDFKLFSPEFSSGRLGYVEHSYNKHNIYQRIGNFFIGSGPVWFGVGVIFLLSKWLLPIDFVVSGNSWNDLQGIFKELLTLPLWQRWESWVWLYLVLCISSHITLSPADIEGGLDGLVVLIIGILLLILGVNWFYPIAENLLGFCQFFYSWFIPIFILIAVVLLLLSLILRVISLR